MKKYLYFFFKHYEKKRSWLKRKATDSGRMMLALFCILVFFGLNTERSMCYQLLPLISLFLLIAYLFSLRFNYQLSCNRTLPETCIVGQELTYSVQITNDTPATLKGMFFQEWRQTRIPTKNEYQALLTEWRQNRKWFQPTSGYSAWKNLTEQNDQDICPHNAIPEIPGQTSIEFSSTLKPDKRGSLHLDGFFLARKDPLGLFYKKRRVDNQANILVLPKLYPIPPITFPGSRKYHQGGISAAGHGDSEEFVSLREYRAGDPLKIIDWKTSAKTGDVIVKQFKNEYFSRFALVLDTFTSENNSEVFEEAVSISGSLLAQHDLGENILDLLFAGTKCYTESIGRGMADQEHILKILASVNNEPGNSFEKLTAHVKNHLALISGIVIILINIDEKRKKLIEVIARSNIAFKIILVTGNRSHSEKLLKTIKTPILVVEAGKITEQLTKI